MEKEPSLQVRIVDFLAGKRMVDYESIAEHLKKQAVMYSKQAVYQQLRRLVDIGSVIKSGKMYSLSLPWVLEYVERADRMFDTHLEGSLISELLPDGKKRSTWNIGNLVRLNAFWVHLMLLILQNSRSRKMQQWVPHPWWLFLWDEGNLQFQRALQLGGFEVQTILGNETPLDLLYKEHIAAPERLSSSTSESPFHGNDRLYIQCCDDYMLTLKLDKKVAIELDQLYLDTSDVMSMNVERASELLTRSATHSLKLERGTPNVRKNRRDFEDYFV